MYKRQDTSITNRIVDDFQSATGGNVNGRSLNYRYYDPIKVNGVSEDGKYPLILFLHGGGEKGDNNLSHLIANKGAVTWVEPDLSLIHISFAATSRAEEPEMKEPGIVTIRSGDNVNGKIQGVPSDTEGVTVYKGVPFAEPPVGELRWKAPQDLTETWDDVRVCDKWRCV